MHFIALLRALGMVVDSHGVSHAQLERMLCERIAAGRRAEERLRVLPPANDHEELRRLAARKTAVEESGLARADGRREKAGGQRIGELLAGKFPKNAMPPRRRVEVCVDVMLGVLEDKDPRGYAEDRYGNRELWFELWLEADQGKLPSLGERARTVTGYVDIALAQLTAADRAEPPAPTADEGIEAPAPAEAVPTEVSTAVPTGHATARLTAIAVALGVIAAGLAVALVAVLWAGPAGPSGGEVVLQFPAPYALAPGPGGLTLPLDLAGTGHKADWVLTLRLRLVPTSTADACVHDSQLGYTLRNNGTVVGRGLLPQGQPQLTAGPLRLGDIGDGHRIELTVTATVGGLDAGCRFTLDPSGTSASAG